MPRENTVDISTQHNSWLMSLISHSALISTHCIILKKGCSG